MELDRRQIDGMEGMFKEAMMLGRIWPVNQMFASVLQVSY